MTPITEKAQQVLVSISRGASTRDAIARKLGTSIQTVNGSITALKRNGLAEVHEDGQITLTPDANPYLGKRTAAAAPATGRSDSKMTQARMIFERFAEREGRQGVLNRLRETVGLTAAGASTYFQTLRREAGIPAGAFQRAPRTPKTVSRKAE